VRTPDAILDAPASVITGTRLMGNLRKGHLPITADDLRDSPSGNLFALTQNVAMGAEPGDAARPPYLILSTQGGLRGEDGRPIALGYHTGHWEIGLLVREAAETLRAAGMAPFAAACSDPCDGRSQGTTAMFDSLPYRNDAAIVLRRLIRSLPTRVGVMGVATCDKGLPAMLLALAGTTTLPGIVVPGGVTLPAPGAEDAGTVQTLGARFAHDLVSLDYAAEMGCRACGSAGGGCQFLGTAATAQVVAEALGLTLPHAGLVPSGEPIWLDLARRSALALVQLVARGTTIGDVLGDAAIENALLVHAAFGGSTNLLLHVPAIAATAGLRVPTVADWAAANRATPRLVDALPNGPRNHPTVQVYLAGGVPEVMLHLRRMGLLRLDAPTVSGLSLDATLDWWEQSERRALVRERLGAAGRIDPDDVIMSPDRARAIGLTGTVIFPTGNLAPDGAVVKATAIDPGVVDDDGVFRHRGPARVFTSEHDAVRAIKGLTAAPVREGDVVVLAGIGPAGTGMEEIYQVTSALKFVPWGKRVPVVTDGRFSGVSTGACIGHVGPEALAGGPLGRLRDGDEIEIEIDRLGLTARVDLVGADAARLLRERATHPGLAPHPELPDDTRLWAALQEVSGGTWAGCVYDVERILAVLAVGRRALDEPARASGAQRHPDEDRGAADHR
jgi:putative YjhG/YagF family dehydratase